MYKSEVWASPCADVAQERVKCAAGATSALSFANFSSALVAPPAGKGDRFTLMPRVLDFSKQALSTSEDSRQEVRRAV